MTPLLPSLRIEGLPLPAFEAVSPGLALAASLDAAIGKAQGEICGSLGTYLSRIIALCDDSTCKGHAAGRSAATIAECMRNAGGLPDVSAELVTLISIP